MGVMEELADQVQRQLANAGFIDPRGNSPGGPNMALRQKPGYVNSYTTPDNTSSPQIRAEPRLPGTPCNI